MKKRGDGGTRISRGNVVVFFLVAFLGLIVLPQPLEGDQSLFLIFAKRMASGGVLYRDLWDLKQPGIFDFYFVAGIVGGFNAIAVHALELAGNLAFAAVLTIALQRSRTLHRGARLAPLFVIGSYYINASPFEQLQVEAFAGFPIFVTCWLTSEAIYTERRDRHLLLGFAGFAAGCAILLKLLFVPLLVGVVFTILAFPCDRYRPTIAFVSRGCASLAVGGALPIGMTLALLARAGALGTALRTWFVIPTQIISLLPAQPVSTLTYGIWWFVHLFAAAIVLAMAGVFFATRRGEADAFSRAMLVWLPFAAVTVLIQRTSWWPYHWLLLGVPIGVFAATGLAALWPMRTSWARGAVLVVAALMAIPLVRNETHNLGLLARHRLAIAAVDRERLRIDASMYYRNARADEALAPKDSSVYVMGNPVYYVVTDRTQPLVLNGWALHLLLADQCAELLREFRAAPPAYVLTTTSGDGSALVMARSPAFAAYFREHYHVSARGALGTLYRYET